jgi:hypothetical protein
VDSICQQLLRHHTVSYRSGRELLGLVAGHADVVLAGRPQVKEARKLRVVSVSEKEERRQRPHGLNTVEMLKVCGATQLVYILL